MRTIASGGFARFAWAVVAYILVVVLWGALVRATGSGAGCGGHWPLCNGEWTPHSPAIATLIEFTHRAMSGLALASVAVLCVWAFRRYARGSPLRKLAVLSAVFLCLEALPLTVLLGMTGAVAALGDTLFPASSIGAGLSQDFSAAAHFLVRLRAVHPALAIATGACIFYVASAAMKARREARNTALAVWLLVLVQIVVGALNIALLAPVWMQLVHLALRTAAKRTEGSSYVELV